MAVDKFRVFLEEDIDNSGETVIVVRFLAILAEMDFSFLKVIAFKFFNLYLELLSEEFTVRLGPVCVFLDHLP